LRSPFGAVAARIAGAPAGDRGPLDARLRSAREAEGVVFPVDVDVLVTAETWTLTKTGGDLDSCFTPRRTLEQIREHEAEPPAPGR
jgi:hypothetical protein